MAFLERDRGLGRQPAYLRVGHMEADESPIVPLSPPLFQSFMTLNFRAAAEVETAPGI